MGLGFACLVLGIAGYYQGRSAGIQSTVNFFTAFPLWTADRLGLPGKIYGGVLLLYYGILGFFLGGFLQEKDPRKIFLTVFSILVLAIVHGKIQNSWEREMGSGLNAFVSVFSRF